MGLYYCVLLFLPAICYGELVQPTTPTSGCIHNDGKLYPLGSTFSPTPCEHCVCPSSGGRTFCAIMDCMMPPCVDAVKNQDQCCSTCPNGPNCYLEDKIIPAGKDVVLAEKICRCPDSPQLGFGLGSTHIQAECSLIGPDGVVIHNGPR